MALFNEFHIQVDEETVESLFGGKIELSLLNFIRLSHSRESLQAYYKAFKKVERKLVIKCYQQRRYMPTTFDEMMVNLGYHAERREIKGEIEV